MGRNSAMRKMAAAALIWLLLAGQALAWNDVGHKLVAAIAFRTLTPAEQTAIADLLRQHPRYKEDFAPYMPQVVAAGDQAAKDEWCFHQASYWPDTARNLPEKLQPLYNRPKWHYIDLPRFLTEADRAALAGRLTENLELNVPALPGPDMNVVQAIRHARGVLGDPRAPAADRALMLAWLFHTVGDLHQPMHSTAMYSQKLFPRGDLGGNLILTQQATNLHVLWDGFLGRREKFTELRSRAIALAADDRMKSLGAAAAKDLDEQTWLHESHQLALEFVYDPEVLAAVRLAEAGPAPSAKNFPPILLSDDYLKAGGNVSLRRVVQAGHRLGAILKQVAAR